MIGWRSEVAGRSYRLRLAETLKVSCLHMTNGTAWPRYISAARQSLDKVFLCRGVGENVLAYGLEFC